MISLRNFSVIFGGPGERQETAGLVIQNVPGPAEFTIRGDWTVEDGGPHILGLRVTNADTGRAVGLLDESRTWVDILSAPHDFSTTPGQFRQENQVFVYIARAGTHRLRFEHLLDDEVIGSAEITIEGRALA